MTTHTREVRRAVEEASDQPVEITETQTNASYVLVNAEIFRRMKEEQDQREKDTWAKLGRKARSDWAKENPY